MNTVSADVAAPAVAPTADSAFGSPAEVSVSASTSTATAPATATATATATSAQLRPLSDRWRLWAHLPQNPNWDKKSYILLHTASTLEEAVALTESLPSVVVETCMLFLMREHIFPEWENEYNKHGGCFSYKVTNKHVVGAWKELTYRVVGGSLSTSDSFLRNVTGITISPKKQFCIIKIWMANRDHQNSGAVAEVKGLQSQGCLFKLHGEK